MKQSLVAATFDLLAFHKAGNYGKFDRCFSKACRFVELAVSDQQKTTLRNLAFHYLRCTGFLDVSASDSATHWSVSPNAVAELRPGEFVAVGESRFLKQVIGHLDAARVSWLTEPERESGLPEAVQLYPALPLIKTDERQIAQICKVSQGKMVLAYQRTFFERLPGIGNVAKHCLAVERDEVPLDPNTAERMNFDTENWELYPETRILDAGLYRRSYRFAPPDFFIASTQRRGRLEVVKVLEREWYAFAALWKLGLKVKAVFRQESKLLTLPRVGESFRIPTLVERALRSGSFVSPNYGSDGRVYSGVSATSVWSLAAKLPIFSVETK